MLLGTSTYMLTSQNIEIPEEMSLFAELKTLTENAQERSVLVEGQQTGGRKKLPRSGGTSLNDVPRMQPRAGEGEATGDTADAEVGDLISQMQSNMKLSAQLQKRSTS